MNDETVEEADRLEGAPHPREHGILVGHAEAEASVLGAWQSGRLPHAFLIGGPEGIGKATLAYRIARFVLAHPAPDKKPRQDLSVAEDHPVSRQVAVLSHPDLLVLRRVMNEESKKLRTEIRVDDVRRIVSFFGSTPAFGGYRVCIVDCLEEMNAAGLNSLLKLVEEPPAKSLFLIVSNTPGRVMATIRSRCQRMRLNSLSTEEVSRAVTALAARMPELPRAQISDAAAASGGSVRRALELLLGEGLEVRSLSTEMLERLPSVDPAQAAHARRPLAGRSGARRLHRNRRGLAGFAARRGRTSRPLALHAMPRHGRRSAALRSRPTFSGSTASRSCSRSSPCSRMRPAVRAGRARSRIHDNQAALLPDHRDLLSERRAAYRPRLRGDRQRRHCPLPAARRLRRVLHDRRRRARHEDDADGGQGGHRPRQLADRNTPLFVAMCNQLVGVLRPLHPHHRARPLRGVARCCGNAWRRPGDIYLGTYAGWYSVRDEAFTTRARR